MKTCILLSFLFFFSFTQASIAQKQRPTFNCIKEPNPISILNQQFLKESEKEKGDSRVAVFYVIPKDAAYSQAEYDAIKSAMFDIQAWYQINTGGVSFKFSYPETVILYRAEENTEYYAADWWGKLLPEMQSKGHPIWQSGTIASLWIKTGNPNGIGLGAQWCDSYCGVAIAGVENFPEFNPYGRCPGGTGGDAWPCVPHGTMAHELGHAFGLPHPYDVDITRSVAWHSVMQSHWNYPYFAPEVDKPWGLLTVERLVLQDNPFFYQGIDLNQIYTADIVNLPVTGPLPNVDFDLSIHKSTITLINKTVGANLYYWTFGDGTVSNEISPVHKYKQPGNYTIELRASNSYGMTQLSTQTISVTNKNIVKNKPLDHGPIVFYPNPNTDGIFYIKAPPVPFSINIALMNSSGNILWTQSISHFQKDNAIDLSQHQSGLYLARVDMAGFSKTYRLVKN
jgi:hypothetical protein